jgi:hypothetical protein
VSGAPPLDEKEQPAAVRAAKVLWWHISLPRRERGRFPLVAPTILLLAPLDREADRGTLAARRSATAWCRESDKQYDPGAPGHHRLSPPDSSGEHAPQILARKGAPCRPFVDGRMQEEHNERFQSGLVGSSQWNRPRFLEVDRV